MNPTQHNAMSWRELQTVRCTPDAMSTIYDRINAALVTLGKRKTPGQEDQANDDNADSSDRSGPARKREHRLVFRPSSQQDLLQRLQTYKPLNWFARPAMASAVECAIRGWVNTGRDSLQCEFCSAQLLYPQKVAPEQRTSAAELFAQQLVTKHAGHCPWRTAQSMRSLLAFQPPATPSEAAELLQQFELRQQRLQQVELLPDIDARVVQQLASADSTAFQKVVLQGKSLDAAAILAAAGGKTEGLSQPASEAAPQPSASPPTAAGTAQAKLTNADRARMLALLGWEMEVLAPDGAGRTAAALSRPDPGQYSLLHLTGGARQHKLPQARAAQQQQHRQQQAQQQQRVNVASVLLTCPDCKARVGLWNFTGPRPAPIGRVTDAATASGTAADSGGAPANLASAASAPQLPMNAAQAAAAKAAPPISATLSRTIAGGSYIVSSGSGGALVPAAPFGACSRGPFGAQHSGPPVFGRPGKVQGQEASQSAAATPTPAPSSSLKRRAEEDAAAPRSLATPRASSTQDAGASASKRLCLVAPDATPSAGTPSGTPSMLHTALGRLMPWRSPSAATTPLASPASAVAAAAASRPAGLSFGGGQNCSTFDAIGHHRIWCPWVHTGVAADAAATVTLMGDVTASSSHPVTPRATSSAPGNGVAAGAGFGSPQDQDTKADLVGTTAAAGSTVGGQEARTCGWAVMMKLVANPGQLTAHVLASAAGVSQQTTMKHEKEGLQFTEGQGKDATGATPVADSAAAATPSRGGGYLMHSVVKGIKDVLRRRG